MRVTGEKIDIDYEKTKKFYKNRAAKYKIEHPYITVIYQDNHPEIAEARNRAETEKILPMLQLNSEVSVLDIGCGIGRWAEVLPDTVKSYFGCDFSPELIKIAKDRNTRPQFRFMTLSAPDCAAYCAANEISKFSRVIISGVMMYLNDRDVQKVFASLDALTEPNAIVYLREPMGIMDRLTLKDFYSEELQHDYNTIYRTRDEYREMLATYAPKFTIKAHGPMFEQAALNNRKETAQFYFILQKMDKV